MQQTQRLTTEELHHRDRSLMGSLERLHGLRLDERPKPGNAEMTMVATAIRPSTNQQAAILAVTQALAPASSADIGKALVALGENCGAPYGSDPDTRLEEWTNFLLGYPADVALVAVKEWPDTHANWPKRAEIKPILDALASKRRRMLVALQGLNATQTEDELYPPASEADVEDVRAIRDRTLAALQSSGKPKKPERGVIDDKLEAARQAEAEAIVAARHSELSEATP